MKSSKITTLIHTLYPKAGNSKTVKVRDYNNLKDDFDALRPSDTAIKTDTISEVTSGSGVTISGLKDSVSAAASVTLTAADSGKVFFIGDSGAVSYVLPDAAAGLKFKFIVIADENDATTITTSDTADTTGEGFDGGLLVCAAAAVNTFVESGADTNRITLDDNVANGACGKGSWLEIIGVKANTWFVTGVINSTTNATGVGSAIFSDVD
jgi:PKD repeat protein